MCLSLLAPKGTPALEERPKGVPSSCESIWAHPSSEVDKSGALGLVSSQPGCLWERQRDQLPQFPNMSDKVSAFGATGAPLYVDERCSKSGHISFYYYFVISDYQSPQVLDAVGCLEAAVLSPCLKGVDSM